MQALGAETIVLCWAEALPDHTETILRFFCLSSLRYWQEWYIYVSFIWSIPWSKTLIHSWAGSSLQFIRSVYSSLISFQASSKQLTGTEFILHFPFKAVNSTFIWISSTGTQSILSLDNRTFIFDSFSGWWLYIVVLNILSLLLLFIQDSFQVLNQRLCMK